MSADEEFLRVAGIVEDSIVDGPGLRCTVFVQGCPHHCAGCHNPSTWDPLAGQERSVAELTEVLHANPLLTGLTLSGGEPTEQANGCAALAEAAHRLGLDVWCYTGFTYERLLARAVDEPDLARLLAAIDVLIDGPYVEARRSLTAAWRGSTNQRLIYLSAPHEAEALVRSRQRGPRLAASAASRGPSRCGGTAQPWYIE